VYNAGVQANTSPPPLQLRVRPPPAPPPSVPPAPHATARVRVQLFDSFGDGWDGLQLVVSPLSGAAPEASFRHLGRWGRYGEVREGMGRCREMWGDVRRYRVRALCAVNTDEVLEEIGTTWVGSIRSG